MNHERKPISIPEIFPVGKELRTYVQDGMSHSMGLWDMKVTALDLEKQTITFRLSQNWEGADTRGGQYWTEVRTLEFSDLIIPIITV